MLVDRDETFISFGWTAAANTGEPVTIGFKVQWNSGSGSTFTTLVTHTDVDNLVFTKSSNIQGGVTYEFRVIATNMIGDSAPSN